MNVPDRTLITRATSCAIRLRLLRQVPVLAGLCAVCQEAGSALHRRVLSVAVRFAPIRERVLVVDWGRSGVPATPVAAQRNFENLSIVQAYAIFGRLLARVELATCRLPLCETGPGRH